MNDLELLSTIQKSFESAVQWNIDNRINDNGLKSFAFVSELGDNLFELFPKDSYSLVVINVKSSFDAQINTTNSLKNSIDNLSSEYLSLLAEQSKNQ